MKGFRFFIGSFVFVLIFSALAFAQTETPQTPALTKIAVIDTKAFDDRTNGIKEIVEAYDKLEAEIKPQADELTALAEKIQKLEKEIKEFQAQIKSPNVGCYMSFDRYLDEYDKLITEYKRKEESTKSLYPKRKAEIFADVYKKVGDAIQQFAKEKGYAAIIDISKERGTFFLVAKDESSDVTEEFIKYYNNNFAKTKTQ